VNGKVVTQGKDCSPRKGYICLESEGGVVHYRNARIKVLPDTSIKPEQVAIANRGYRSIYTGVDLSGWKANGGWKPSDWVLNNKPDAKALVTVDSINDMKGLIIDLRLSEQTGNPKVWLGETAILSIDATALEKPGKWNRFEGTRENGKMHWTINGKPGPKVDLSDSAAGPLKIVPDGPADWANLYVR
jgi:hypothetical protein